MDDDLLEEVRIAFLKRLQQSERGFGLKLIECLLNVFFGRLGIRFQGFSAFWPALGESTERREAFQKPGIDMGRIFTKNFLASVRNHLYSSGWRRNQPGILKISSSPANAVDHHQLTAFQSCGALVRSQLEKTY